MADEIWLDILPSMREFGGTLVKEATKSAKAAGAKAGKDYSGAFEDGAEGASNAAISELETAQKRATGLVQKLSGDVSKARQGQQKSAAAALDAEVKLTTAVEKYGAGSDQAKAATLRLEAARGKAADDTKRFENAENGLREAQKSLTTTTEQLERAQKDVGEEVKTQPKKWGKFGEALAGARDRVENFSGSVGGMVTQLAGAVGGAALLTDAFGTALEGDTAVDRISAALGATPQQAETYGAAAGALYADAYGESMEDVSSAVDAVVSSMGGMRDASAADIEKITGYAMNLAGAFDVDVAEAATTAGSLIKNGLASDATGAFDLITGAMQQVPASLRGEILPVMDEYGKHFQALGIDGETSMGMIIAASGDGAIGMDKMGDALKEFTIRATDMSKTTSGVYSTLGLDMEDMTNDLLAGGDRAEGAMGKIIHGLQNIKDPGEQAAASLALFGTPLEDLGTDQIPNFLGMVDPMGDAFESMDGKAAAMGETLNGGTATSIETVKRSFMGMLTEGITPLLGPLNTVFTWLADTPGVLPAVAIGLAGLATAWGVYTVAQWAANAAMLANPMGLVAAGIALAIAAATAIIVVVVKNWGNIMGWLQNSVLQPFLNWIAPAWDAVMAGISWAWENILKPAWDGVASAAGWLWQTILKPAFDGIKGAWSGALTGISWAWENVLKPAWSAIATAAGWLWTTILQPTFKWISEAWTNWTNNAKWAWENILKPAWNAVAAAGKWLWDNALKPAFGWIKSGWDGMISGISLAWKNVLKPVWDAVKSGAEWLWNNGLKPAFGWVKSGWDGMISGISWAWKHVLKPVWDGVKSGAEWLYNKGIKPAMGWIGDKWDSMVDGIGNTWDKYGKPVFDTIANLVKGDFPAAFESGKKAVKNIWDGIANIVRKPVNFVIKTVYNDGLKSLFNGISSKLGLSWKLPDVDGLPAFAKGGLAKPGWALVGEEGPELVNFSSPGRVYTASETKGMLAGQEQAPTGALDALAGGSPSEALLPAGGFWGDVWGNVTDAVGKAKDWVVGKIADGVRALTNPIKSTISSFLPGKGINELIRGGANKLINDMVGWAVGADDKKAAEQAAEFGGAVYDGPLGRFHRPSKGPYTSMYGPRWGGFHTGVDIAGGGPTYAALPGVVQRVGWNAVAGKTGIGIYLNHGPGLWTYYGHNPVGGPQVKVGDQVKAGQHIGYQGATGNVTGVHTHFEVHEGRVNGVVNPMKYLHDTGGVHEPGTWSYNGLQQPEYVFTEPQWATLDALAARGASVSDLPGDITVVIKVEDLEGIKTVEEFIAMARRRARQKKGS